MDYKKEYLRAQKMMQKHLSGNAGLKSVVEALGFIEIEGKWVINHSKSVDGNEPTKSIRIHRKDVLHELRSRFNALWDEQIKLNPDYCWCEEEKEMAYYFYTIKEKVYDFTAEEFLSENNLPFNAYCDDGKTIINLPKLLNEFKS